MSKTPLCDKIAGYISYDTCVEVLKEQQEYGIAHLGRAMLERLNDREAYTEVVTYCALRATTMAEMADHVRAYLLTGRKPWK